MFRLDTSFRVSIDFPLYAFRLSNLFPGSVTLRQFLLLPVVYYEDRSFLRGFDIREFFLPCDESHTPEGFFILKENNCLGVRSNQPPSATWFAFMFLITGSILFEVGGFLRPGEREISSPPSIEWEVKSWPPCGSHNFSCK